MARTCLGESANQFNCVVKGFLALGTVQLGGLNAWEPGLGAEIARLFGKVVCMVPFPLIHGKAFFEV